MTIINRKRIKKLKNKIICNKCNEIVGYIPEDYTIDIKVICKSCNSGRKKKKSKTIRTVTSNYAKTKGGIRQDIHSTYYFRSATEANVARIFDHFSLDWKFEERSFTFCSNKYRTKPWVYIMDFEIVKMDKRKSLPEWLSLGWVEVKGYMNSSSRQKLRRLRINYPEDAKKTLVILYDKYRKKDMKFCDKNGYKWITYDTLVKEYHNKIKGWE